MRGRRLIVFFLALSFAASGAGTWASFAEVNASQAAQRQEQSASRTAGAEIEAKLCATLGRLAALKPPAGNPASNPSRAYLQAEHDTLAQLGIDLGCR